VFIHYSKDTTSSIGGGEIEFKCEDKEFEESWIQRPTGV